MVWLNIKKADANDNSSFSAETDTITYIKIEPDGTTEVCQEGIEDGYKDMTNMPSTEIDLDDKNKLLNILSKNGFVSTVDREDNLIIINPNLITSIEVSANNSIDIRFRLMKSDESFELTKEKCNDLIDKINAAKAALPKKGPPGNWAERG